MLIVIKGNISSLLFKFESMKTIFLTEQQLIMIHHVTREVTPVSFYMWTAMKKPQPISVKRCTNTECRFFF